MRGDGRIELEHLNLGWNDTRTEHLLARVKHRIDRRARVRRAVLASAALTSVACIAAFALRSSPSSNVAAPAIGAATPALIRLGEGSEIRVDPTASEVRVVEDLPSRVRVEAIRGGAHYSVIPNLGRSFEVASGSVTVRVVGTEFQVERREDKTFVAVSRGKVEVIWDGGAGHDFISAGGSGIFPRPRSHDDARAQSPSVAYRARVGSHDFRGAYAILARHPALAGDTVKELLVAADVARLSEHPAEAVVYLQRIVREHPRDERAHQAAFTLGRTLSGLGRTKEAMSMFGRVRSDWPGNPLAEDALVRQAEAAGALGDIAAARRLAGEYERDYPNGQRRAEVRRYARLE
jgi:transmembrane sensor